MPLDLNDPELEFSDLVTAYQSWVMAVINDEKLGGEKLLTDEIADDAIVAEDVVKLEIEDRLFDHHGAGPALRNLQRKSLYPIRDRKNYFSKIKLC